MVTPAGHVVVILVVAAGAVRAKITVVDPSNEVI